LTSSWQSREDGASALLRGAVYTRARRLKMANRAIWSMRKRHEWLATPLKAKRVKRATRVRSGQQDAMDRKAGLAGAEK
jgi:hypothetical protein